MFPFPVPQSSPGFALMTAQGVAPAGGTAAAGEASAAAPGSAALTARDLLHISSHLLKREVHGRLKACLEAALPLGQLPQEEDAAAAHADAVEAAQYEDVVPVRKHGRWLRGGNCSVRCCGRGSAKGGRSACDEAR